MGYNSLDDSFIETMGMVRSQYCLEVGTKLAEVRSKRSELQERELAAEHEFNRIDIRAFQDGIMVHDFVVPTVGGVIAAREPIMRIVLSTDSLLV